MFWLNYLTRWIMTIRHSVGKCTAYTARNVFYVAVDAILDTEHSKCFDDVIYRPYFFGRVSPVATNPEVVTYTNFVSRFTHSVLCSAEGSSKPDCDIISQAFIPDRFGFHGRFLEIDEFTSDDAWVRHSVERAW